MLSSLRRLLAVLLVVTALVSAAQSPAAAGSCPDGSDPVSTEHCDAEGNCSVVLECPGDDGGDGGDDGDGGDGSSGTSTCTFQGQTIPCQIGNAPWNGSCYVSDLMQSDPQNPPPAGQSADDGDWYACICPPAATSCPSWAWVRPGETFINPEVLARRAIAAMDLDPIAIGIVPESGPDRMGLVGLPVWMWVENQTANTWGPISDSASEGTVSVSATATVAEVVWDMGDGSDPIRCGAGTPYRDTYGKKDSPTCGHRYQLMSDDQDDGAYEVTATSHWVIEWSGGGQTGTIELNTTTDPLPIRIGEAQVLTQ